MSVNGSNNLLKEYYMASTGGGSTPVNDQVLGRGGQTAQSVGGIRAPVTTTTHDLRDGSNPHYNENVSVTDETNMKRPGRGGHNRAITGGI